MYYTVLFRNVCESFYCCKTHYLSLLCSLFRCLGMSIIFLLYLAKRCHDLNEGSLGGNDHNQATDSHTHVNHTPVLSTSPLPHPQLPDQKASQSSLKNDLYTDRTLWKDEPLDCILLSSLMTPYFSRSEVTDRHRLRQQGGDGEMHFCPFVHQGVLFSFFWGSVGGVS